MDMKIYFPGNKKVNADFQGFTIATDQPVSDGGDASAPGPFDLFLASIGTCAGIFVLGFCQKRGISTEGIHLIQKMDKDPETQMIKKISLDIIVPADFPEKYRESLISVANLCKVKKHIHHAPEFEIKTITT